MALDQIPSQLEQLLESTRQIRSEFDLKTYLQLLVDAASELTESEGASLLVSSKQGQSNVLRFVATPSLQWETLKYLEVPVESSLVGRVYETGQPEIINNTRAEKRLYATVDRLTGIETHSLTIAPLIFKGLKIGVMAAVNRRNATYYTEEDLAILEILAAQAALLLYDEQLEKNISAAQREIAILDRMKSDFISIASHELRTPLGLILGHSTFLREQVGKEFYEHLDVVIRSATKLKEIIENLSNVENIQSGTSSLRSRNISIKRLIMDLVAKFQIMAAEKGITLRASLGVAPLILEGDAEKISIVLENIITNAITFTNPGGAVGVTAEEVPGYIKIIVVDTGIGIPVVDLGRVFERFYQVESHLTRKHGGMGLGLSVAKMMVELHGGRIWAESKEGKGSSFSILMPTNLAQKTAAQKVFIG